ncbi:MAG: phage protease [Halobacteria archaeon]
MSTKPNDNTSLLETLLSEQVLEQVREQGIDLSDKSLSDLADLLDDTPADWTKQDGKYVTCFAFDEFSELDQVSPFMKREDMAYELGTTDQGQFCVTFSTESKSAAQAFNDAIEQEEVPVRSFNDHGQTKTPQPESESATETVSGEAETDGTAKRQFDEEPGSSKLFPLTNSQIQHFEQNHDYYVKLPIAKKGEWKHPLYGDVEFSDQELAQIKENIESNVLGWEPPVFYGHPERGGAAAEGFLADVEQNEDTLYGIWNVNQDAYQEIQNGRYRYSSSEFMPDYQDKTTGESVGTVLTGMALTNQPFIPNLPRNLPLSEEEYLFSMEVDTHPKQFAQELDMPENKTDIEQLQQKLEESQQKIEELQNQQQALKEHYETQLEEAKNRIDQLQNAQRQREVNQKLAKLEELNLPPKVKERTQQQIQDGSLGEHEDEVIQSLEDMSSRYSAEVFEQKGESEGTQEQNQRQEYQDPLKNSVHAGAINHNQKLAEEKKQKMKLQ